MSNTTISKNKERENQFYAAQEAQEALVKLFTLRPLLSPQDEETLTILMDKKLMKHLNKSINESNKKKGLEPIENILK